MKQLTSVSTIFGWPWPNWASANTDAQFGIINNQQPLSSHHHPQHLAPLPHITTVPNSHSYHWLPTTTAHDHQWQCGNTMSLAATTTRTCHSQLPSTAYNHSTHPPMAMWQLHVTHPNDHQNSHRWQRTPKNEHKEHEQPHPSQPTTSTYKWTQSTTRQGEPAHFPPPFFLL